MGDSTLTESTRPNPRSPYAVSKLAAEYYVNTIGSLWKIDPAPSLRIESGRVVELDGKPREEFDTIDVFIADHAIDLAVAEQAMARDPLEIARMLADINVPREHILRLASGCTPAMLCRVVSHLSVLEMMLGLAKMRARRTPANQAHVTNRREHPALLAADTTDRAQRAGGTTGGTDDAE